MVGRRREGIRPHQQVAADRQLAPSLTRSQLVDEEMDERVRQDELRLQALRKKSRRASSFRMTGEWADGKKGGVWLPKLSKAEKREEMLEMLAKWEVDSKDLDLEDKTAEEAREEWYKVKADMLEAWEKRETLTEKLQEHLERMAINKRANEEMQEEVEGAKCQLDYFDRLRDQLTEQVIDVEKCATQIVC
eukprot:754594-Hanusia_phi.AAC.3